MPLQGEQTPEQIADLPGLSSPVRKNISVFPKCKSVYMFRHPVLLRGALAIVTNVGRAAVDATASDAQGRSQGEMNLVSDMRRVNDPRRSVRQNRVVLASVADVKFVETSRAQPGLAMS